MDGARRRPLERLGFAVLLLGAAFAVIYLVAANVVLRTRLLRDLVSDGPDVELSYESAYSVWPGLVHVRGLGLQIQNYADQLSITAESGLVQVSLHDLLFRRFRATSVSIAGLSFRYRDKLPAGEIGAPRVAAYPPITGFPDPPVLVGERPAPTPDKDYDQWNIGLENVRAELRELWFFEYHYLGGGRVRGGFELQPGRFFAVYPASLSLERGELNVGDALAVQRLLLDLDGHIDFTDLRETHGAAIIEKMNGRVSLEAKDINLGVLDSRASVAQPPRVEGKADFTLAASVVRGQLEPRSSAELDAQELSVSSPVGTISGATRSNVTSDEDGRIDWVTSASRLRLSSGSRQPGPVLDNARLAIVLRSSGLGHTPELSSLELDVPQLKVPSLGWAKRWLERAGAPLELRGRLEGRAHLSFARGKGPSARLGLRVMDAELSSADVREVLTGRIDAELAPVAGDTPSSSGRVDIELDGVETVRQKSKPFRAAIRMPDVRLSLQPEQTLSTSVDMFAKPADSLLSLAMGAPMLEDLAADVLDLHWLEARARVNVSERAVRFELSRAESGALTGSGFWQRPAAGSARGAFLISSKVANVGISLSGSEAETAWFVADDWLSRARQAPVRHALEPAERSGERANVGARTR